MSGAAEKRERRRRATRERRRRATRERRRKATRERRKRADLTLWVLFPEHEESE